MSYCIDRVPLILILNNNPITVNLIRTNDYNYKNIKKYNDKINIKYKGNFKIKK